MLIYPAIDLFDGKAVRLYKGDYAQMTVYSDDPVSVALDFQNSGARWIHLVDLQGAKSGNTDNLSTIRAIQKATNLRCEVGGGIRNMETVETYLTAGIDRVDIKTTFCNQSENHRVRAMFAPGIQTEKCLADGQFDLVERHIYPQWEQFINPSNCQRSQAFFALEDEQKGLAVAAKGLHEHEILRNGENTMALTLLRCVGEVGDWGVFPTPKMQLKGEHTVEYSVVPYAAENRADAFALAHAFADSIFTACQVDPNEGGLKATSTLVAVDNPALVTSACKRSEDRRFTAVRLYNPLCEDVEAELTVDASAVYESNLAETVGNKLPMADGKVKITVPAKKIVTYLLR